jgi:hypothetical protein
LDLTSLSDEKKKRAQAPALPSFIPLHLFRGWSTELIALQTEDTAGPA